MVGQQELPILERSNVRNDIQARAGMILPLLCNLLFLLYR
jgi:hypothetical protein